MPLQNKHFNFTVHLFILHVFYTDNRIKYFHMFLKKHILLILYHVNNLYQVIFPAIFAIDVYTAYFQGSIESGSGNIKQTN